jgi:hypothetical protein
MGLFDSISDKFKQATGADLGGALIGGSLGGGAGAVVGGFFGEDISDFLSDPTGAKKAAKIQAQALREAGQLEAAARMEALALQAQFLEETAPFREAGREALGQLQAEVQAPIGESPLFQRGLQAGLTGLQQRLAGFGLGESSVGALAAGELTAGLTSQEIARRQGILGQLATGGTAGFGLGLGAQQLASGITGRQAQTLADIGAVTAAGSMANRQFYGGLASDILGQAGGFALSSLLGAPPTGGA